MDATTADLTAPTTKNGPRKLETYRAGRRNRAKAKRMLPVWRNFVAVDANAKAKLPWRAEIANGAREAAAGALADRNVRGTGLRTHTVIAVAMLAYYETVQRTRPVSRIIGSLKDQVRA
jgi:hypothetical protein